ncbi:MAG: hypothetical protein JSS72_06875 [Armatimonadetes bacterium]|nr:hypothetical protein [Armatimonadota bacterium]
MCANCYYAFVAQTHSFQRNQVQNIVYRRPKKRVKGLFTAILLGVAMGALAFTVSKSPVVAAIKGGGDLAKLLGGNGAANDQLAKQAQKEVNALSSDAEGQPASLAANSETINALANAAHQALPSLLKEQAVTSPALALDSTKKPVTLAEPTDIGQMPLDIKEWLQHLQRIEESRAKLANSQVAAAAQQLISYQSQDQAAASSEDSTDRSGQRKSEVVNNAQNIDSAWASLEQDFLSKNPPAECGALADAYNHVLGETRAMITEIAHAVQSAGSDPTAAIQSLSAMQGQSGARIDQPALASDGLLNGICNKYHVQKWFSIGKDYGANLSGF